MSIIVLQGGTRQNGNTQLLTEHAVKGISSENINLRDYVIEPIVDMRHTEEGFQEKKDDYNKIIELVLQNDVMIFSTPIYWYSMSGTMKNFIDRWSQSLRDSKYPEFKKQMASKKAFVIAVGGDEPNMKGLPMIQQFKYIFDFMGIEFGGYIIGKGNKPGDILEDKEALFSADQLNGILKGLQ